MDQRQLLKAARDTWRGLESFRLGRQRSKLYTYGDQWSDKIITEDRRVITERDHLIESGNRPYTNNLIRQLVKTIVGRYRTNAADNGTYTKKHPLPQTAERNRLSELDARMLEEFLISGCALQRVGLNEHGETEISNLDPRRFFCDRGIDPRSEDVTIAGVIHDMSFGAIMERFGNGTAVRDKWLKNCFAYGERRLFGSDADFATICGDPFLTTGGSDCRVIEVWTLDLQKERDDKTPTKEVAQPNEHRIRRRWRCRWLSPYGQTLAEYDTPYAHGQHPFAIKFYPLIDGETHSFVEDIIDQQRFINRLIVNLDRMLASSAKGVLLFPVDQLTPEVGWDKICRAWSRHDSIIPIRGQGRELPQQITGGNVNEGAYRLLDLQLKMLDNVSGVSDALMGRNIGGNAGAAVYEAQAKNSSIAIADLLETFTDFTKSRDAKAAAAQEHAS